MNQDSQPEIEGLIERLNGYARMMREMDAPDSIFDLLTEAASALLSLKEGGGLASCTDSAASVASQPDCSTAQSFAGKGANYCVRCERPTPRDFCPTCGTPLDPPAEAKP